MGSTADAAADDGALAAQRQALAPVLNACRCMMLMEPVALEFNGLTMLEPYERMAKIATVVSEIVGVNDTFRDIVRRDNVPAVLQQQAILRKKGEAVLPAAFGADLPDPAAERNL